MKKIPLLATVLFILLFSTFVFAQMPTPTPPATDENDVVKISTTLIQVDATVTDKKGKVVTDLKTEDFEIYENGQKQGITNFSFIFAAPENKSDELTQSPKPKEDKSSVPLSPAKFKPEQVRRTYALVVDDLGLSFGNSFWVKQSLKKFITEQMQEGDLVAIFRVSGSIGTLQSFTSDKRQLLATVDKIHWNGQSRTGADSYPAVSPDFNTEVQAMTGRTVEGIEQNNQGELQAEAARQGNLGIGTLGALNYLIRGMQILPGRKSLMLFSEGFRIFDYSNFNLRPEQTRIADGLRNLADVANRSSVVIYTIDPRGLEPLIGGGYVAEDDVSIKAGAKSAEKQRKEREDNIRDSKATLKYLAEETGGLAYVDGNDMNYGLQKFLNDQKGYYLIGYQPDSETFDPNKSKYNHLTIKLKRPDLQVRYRSGFFGITDEKFKSAFQNSPQGLSAALISPFGATGVKLDLYSVFVNDIQNKNFIRSFIHIDAKDLTFTKESNDFYRASIEILAMTFGDNGNPIDQIVKSYSIKVDANHYQEILQKGFIYSIELPVKKPGAYQFRISLRDTGSKKIGSASQFIEIPDISKKNLTLSNLIVKNYSVTDWKRLSANQNSSANADFFLDTTQRQFKRGTVVAYSYIIYNAKTDSLKNRQLQIQTKLFRNGSRILESEPAPYNSQEQTNPQRIEVSDAITLGTKVQPGDYVLQLIVSDGAKGEKTRIAAQSIDFEVIE